MTSVDEESSVWGVTKRQVVALDILERKAVLIGSRAEETIRGTLNRLEDIREKGRNDVYEAFGRERRGSG